MSFNKKIKSKILKEILQTLLERQTKIYFENIRYDFLKSKKWALWNQNVSPSLQLAPIDVLRIKRKNLSDDAIINRLKRNGVRIAKTG